MSKNQILVEVRGGNVVFTAFTKESVDLTIIDHDNATTITEQAVPEINLYSDLEMKKYISENGYTDEMPEADDCYDLLTR